MTSHSLEEIGGYFGGRDHSTVLHATRTIGRQRRDDPRLACSLRQLEQSKVKLAGIVITHSTDRSESYYGYGYGYGGSYAGAD